MPQQLRYVDDSDDDYLPCQSLLSLPLSAKANKRARATGATASSSPGKRTSRVAEGGSKRGSAAQQPRPYVLTPENEEDEGEEGSQKWTDVAAQVTHILQQQKARLAKKDTKEKKRIRVEFEQEVIEVKEAFVNELKGLQDAFQLEVQQLLETFAAEKAQQDQEDAAFAKEVADFEKDLAGFEKKLKSDLKKFQDAKTAAEQKCCLAVSEFGRQTDARIERSRLEAQKVANSKLPLQPVVNHLQDTINHFESVISSAVAK